MAQLYTVASKSLVTDIQRLPIDAAAAALPPHFTCHVYNGNNKIIPKENYKIVSDPPEVANIFNALYGSSLIIQLIILMD